MMRGDCAGATACACEKLVTPHAGFVIHADPSGHLPLDGGRNAAVTIWL